MILIFSKWNMGFILQEGLQNKSVWIAVDLTEIYFLHILQGIGLLLDLELRCLDSHLLLLENADCILWQRDNYQVFYTVLWEFPYHNYIHNGLEIKHS